MWLVKAQLTSKVNFFEKNHYFCCGGRKRWRIGTKFNLQLDQNVCYQLESSLELVKPPILLAALVKEAHFDPKIVSSIICERFIRS